MFRRLILLVAIVLVSVCLAGVVDAADIVVVHDENPYAFFGFYGSSLFADQPKKLFRDTVAWSVNDQDPNETAVLLFTYDGTVSTGDPLNVEAVGFYNLLVNFGYQVQVDTRTNFAARTDYSGFDLVVFPNFLYSDVGAPSATSVRNAEIPFITMEPAHTDELDIGTGVTVFSGTLDQASVVDNLHAITDEYGLYEIILMAQQGAPGNPFDVPTEGITTSGSGRVLIGEVPEPASVLLLTVGGLLGAVGLRRRKTPSTG